MKVAIAGAGIAGPATAFWLASQGHECTVIERFPSLRAAGMQVDLRKQAIEVVRRMGLLDAVHNRSVQELGTILVDSKGLEKVVQRRNDIEDESGQGMTSAYEIMRRDLIEILYEATDQNVTYKFGLSVASYQNHDDKVIITLSDGSVETYDLLVAADGQGSRIRKQMFFYKPEMDYTRWLGVFSAYYTLPRREYDTSYARIYHGTGRRLAMTRWHSNNMGQAYLMAMSNQEKFRRALDRDIGNQKDAFLDVFKNLGWQGDRLMMALADAGDFYADEMLQRKSSVWSMGRVVLVGDSAYCASPVAGVGASMAFIGAYVLAGELAIYGDDIEGALASYDRVLRPLAEESQKLPRGSPQSWLPLSAWGIKSLHAKEWMRNMSRTLGLPSWARTDVQRDTWVLPDYPEMCWRKSMSTSGVPSADESTWSMPSTARSSMTDYSVQPCSAGQVAVVKHLYSVRRPSTAGEGYGVRVLRTTTNSRTASR
ncbi:hypothetical protein K4F52_004464 [Lecanicillium sp. MT-2017a]|nr:hypothetical protein K4F52_004464 [Lecanicillium sp. MT-2017a]